MYVLLFLVATSPARAGWRDDVKASVEACQTTPRPCEVAGDLFIREARDGSWLAQDPRLGPDVPGPLLHRLEREREVKLRVAVAHAASQVLLDGVDASWHVAWAELAATDRDAEVRSLFVNTLRRAPATAALPGLRAALAHDHEGTRERAAATMGASTHAAAFVDDLVGALQDPSDAVRRAAVRSLGYAGDARALGALQAMAGDEAVATELPRALRRARE